MTDLVLLDESGRLSAQQLSDHASFARPTAPLTSRTAYAAAHVVPRAWADNTPGAPAEIDWDATLAIRENIYSWGLGVADAMDTAQRNMGLDYPATQELIKRSAELARAAGGALVVGVNTDHRDEAVLTLDEIVTAYLEQLEYAEDQGATPVIMASRHLAAAARGADDYIHVYDSVLRRATAPVVLHWLGTAFDPQLRGYFGAESWQTAAETLLTIVDAHAGRIAGIKMSLLNAQSELAVRSRLPEGVRMFTGDDFNYVELIGGADLAECAEHGVIGHSDALLGAFAAIPSVASAAIRELDSGRPDAYRELLAPTTELSRQIFAAPTFYYKTGVAFMAWLNGHQPAFQMVGGLQSARSLPHLSRIVELANAAGALEAPELAARRWHGLLRLNGIGE